MAIHSLLSAPTSTEDASQVVDYVVGNLQRNYDIVFQSVRTWDREGCHLIAQALKGCHHYGHGHMLGQSLRNLANAAIMREHHLSNRAA